ncbi:MAG: pyrroline-5-carboxylate reductase [Candidatus Pacebacteria bacterium]|nr:pyrroline-5-carboxylate reductase [Candidatus Paceibacterota bacterium]
MDTKTKTTTIGILGYGNMGQAIVAQLQTMKASKMNIEIVIHSLGVSNVPGARCVESSIDLFEASDFVFVCVKPQDFYQLKTLTIKNAKHLIVVSIMAGVRIVNIQKVFPGAKVVRVMPNLPLQIGQGVIGWYLKKDSLTSDEQAFLEKVFSVFGLSVPLQEEKMLDALTAVSGSGPAYVFLFANALIKSARELGFSQDVAEKIVIKAITGSIAYAVSKEHPDFERLIQMVQSKGGTTEAALNTLDVENYYTEWQKAIKKAYERAQEISSHDSK